jgi:hypothetical protein
MVVFTSMTISQNNPKKIPIFFQVYRNYEILIVILHPKKEGGISHILISI